MLRPSTRTSRLSVRGSRCSLNPQQLYFSSVHKFDCRDARTSVPCDHEAVHSSELSRFSTAERFALVRDGHAVVSEGIVCTVDTLPGPRLRLDAHLTLDRDDAVAIEQSALWVLGVSPAAPHDLQAAGLDGVRLYAGSSEARVRELKIQRSDCTSYGNKLVSSPDRTAADIARYSPDDTAALAQLAELSQKAPYDTDVALSIVGRTAHLPFARRARERLGAALADAVGVVDAINTTNSVEETIEVAGVAHLEDEPVQGQTLRRRRNGSREDVDVVFSQDASDV